VTAAMTKEEYAAYLRGIATARTKIVRLQLGLAYAFVILVLVLAYFVHTYNQREYDRCLRSHDNTVRINTTNSALHTYLAQLQGRSKNPEQLGALVRIFRDAALPVPNCGESPSYF